MSAIAHKSLIEALLAFQEEAPTLPKDGRNPHFNSKFTKLDTVREKVGPLLVKHGLTWQTFPCFGDDGAPALRYLLSHVSGESQSDKMPLGVPPVCKPQDLGSAYAYARRYSVCAVLDLVADEDVDGSQTPPAEGNGGQRSAPQTTAQPAQRSERPVSAKQRGLLNVRAAEANLCPTDFANIVLTVCGQELREFESEDSAQQWLNRQLERLPARYVDPILAQFKRLAEAEAVAS